MTSVTIRLFFCGLFSFFSLSSGGFRWTRVMFFRVHRIQEMPWIAEWPFASWPAQLIPPDLKSELRKRLLSLSLAKPIMGRQTILKTCELFIYADIHYLTGPRAHPSSYTMGTGSLPGVNRPGSGVYHPPPSSTEVEGRVELYIYSPSGSSWSVLSRIYLYLLHYITK